MILDPDYARIFTQARIIAWQYGYTCVAHGAYTRSLDLLLVPWTEQARGNDAQLVCLIADACPDLLPALKHDNIDFSEKPHGRRATSILFKNPADRRWVDISIMPCAPKPKTEPL